MINAFWLAFLTGLTTGGLSCLAVQGGLLASSVSQEQQQGKSFVPVILFLLAKLASYTILGFFLGLLGSFFAISIGVQSFLQIAVGIFMLITAARIANIHPIFRYFVIQPPRWVYRLLKNQSRAQTWFAPLSLGFFTVLMPCGVTQAMMVVAVGSGSPWIGAATMFAFVLGTSPVFLALGVAAVKLLEKKLFSYVAAGVIVYFGLLSINGGIALSGSPYTFQNFYKAAVGGYTYTGQGQVAGIQNGSQDATIYVTGSGYSSNVKKLKVGVPVNLSLIAQGARGCVRAFMIPSMGVSQILPENGTKTLAFTPTKTGTLTYSCSMGMYTGSFEVIN